MAILAVAAPYLLGAATVGSAYSQYRGGVAAKTAANREAFQEKARAKEEGITRREQLLDAVAAQNAAYGAGGVTGGVFQTSLTDIKEFGQEQERRTSMSNIRQTEIKRKGSAAKTSGLIGAGTSLLKGGAAVGKVIK